MNRYNLTGMWLWRNDPYFRFWCFCWTATVTASTADYAAIYKLPKEKA